MILKMLNQAPVQMHAAVPPAIVIVIAFALLLMIVAKISKTFVKVKR